MGGCRAFERKEFVGGEGGIRVPHEFMFEPLILAKILY